MSEEQVAASESSPKKSSRFKSGLLLLGFAGVLGISAGIFAANINITTNIDGGIEFGTGTSIISTCVTSAEIEMTTLFTPGAEPKFMLDSVTVSNIVNTCDNDEVIRLNVMDTAGDSLIGGALPSHTIEDNPDSFTADLSGANIDAEDVEYILLETSAS